MKLYLALMTDHRPLSITVFLALLACCLNLSQIGCSKPTSTPLEPTVKAEPNTPAEQNTPGTRISAQTPPANALDACSLLMTKEIEQVQGAPLKDTKRSASAQGGLTISQCYFLLSSLANSIVITVTQKGEGPNGREPKQSWDEIFHGNKEKMSEEDKEGLKPQPISGLGDEAFWVPRPKGGKLYALKGKMYITVGVGSPGDEDQKIQKSKALAEMVLKRL
jgi:hypothetical protein